MRPNLGRIFRSRHSYERMKPLLKLSKQCIALLMALVLVLGTVPTAFAAETTTEPTITTESTIPTDPTETTAETEAAQATTEATEPVSDTTAPTEQTEPVTEDKGPPMMSTGNNGIMTAASTQGSIMLFDFSDNGNYTTVLNSQLTVKYKPNGTGTTRTAYIKNLGWHFARYGNVPYADDPLYCIEPWRNYAASTSGNSVDRDVTLNGSGSTAGSTVWYDMSLARRNAIGLILLYTDELWDHSISVTTTKKDSNPNVPLRIACQFLIYEIVCGLRDAETFQLKSSNESGTAGDIFYNAGVDAVPYFAPNYNQLVSLVQGSLQIPSFTSTSSSTAPTITLTGEETSVYDSNGVLSNFSFSDGNGAEFYKSGNTLYIYQTGDISESTVFRATQYIPSAANSTYCLWYMSGSSYQTTISLYSPSSGTLNAYFKLKAPAKGTINLTKTTENGLNLAGWQFGIYSNSACTSLVAGPYTTNSSGKISVTGLSAGTYYVKELGHTDSSINALYTCSSTNPQKVTLTSGGTSSVSFYNKLVPGNLGLTKTTEDGKNLSGWRFGIYSNSACTSLVSGPHTTDSSGKISVTGLAPGTYYVKELGHTDSSINAMYYCSSTNPQTVTISAGLTASVSFHNKLNLSGLALTKTTEDGQNLAGWKFGIYSDAACATLLSGPYTTDSNGKISVTGLAPGTVYVKELGHRDSGINALYSCSSTNPQTVTLTAGQTSAVSFHNTLNRGGVKLVKETNTGNDLAGWQIGLYLDSACVDPVSGSPFTTGADGTITVTGLEPGTYYAKEVDTGDPYWEYDTAVKTVSVAVNQTATVTFTNTHFGRIEFRKTTNTGNHLGGWTFRVRDYDGNIIGDYTTNENGYACTENLPLGRYTVVELPTEDYYWNCELGFHDVTVKAGETVVDEWLNREQGLGWFHKSTNTGESLEGWIITIYADEACTQELCTTTTKENGRTGYYLDPGIYYAKETGDAEGRFENEYWLVDETVQRFEIKPHEDTEVFFTNIQYGKLKIIKKMEGEGSVAGWQFRITDAQGKEIDGSPFTSGEDGTIMPNNLLPGTYTIEELIPEDSPYYCKSENPQTVTVTQGQVAEVTFTNALRSGEIIISKVDNTGTPRAGAEFLLEWSEDGSTWLPVFHSAIVTKGGCSSTGLTDGKLTSGDDGLVTFNGLHLSLQYRLTETKAPDGLQLLTEAAFQGELPIDTDYIKELTVVNVPNFTMPMTGSKSRLLMAYGLIVCLAACAGSIAYLRRKRW